MHKQRAQTVVEFAFVAPVLIVLVLGVLGIGRAFYTYIDIANAARAGARFATTQSSCPSLAAVNSNVQNFVTPLAVTVAFTCTPTDSSGNTIPNAYRVTITNQFDTLIPHITYLPIVGNMDLFGVVPITVSATLPTAS